jgi:hypothetical protein
MRSPAKQLLRAFLGCCSLVAGITAIADQPPAGEWRGRGDIVVNWTAQRHLAVDLTISPSGVVEGRIGDARLVGGRLTQNRGRLGRALNIKTDYIITGSLEGCIVASESICRESVKIPVNLRDGHFVGGLHTSGSVGGGKDRMILSVARLNLSRAGSQ